VPKPSRPRAADADPGEALRARVAALEADLQELFYVASHDLNEPLRMVTSYLGLLERRYGEQLDDTAREFIHYAVDGAERMRALLDDLLYFSRAGSDEPAREPVAVAEVLDGVLRSLEPAIDEAGATIVVDGPLPVVAADGVQLGQLLQNLIANAVKFHVPGAANRVTVRARRDGDDAAWLLSVSDDGIGIGPRQQERIFQIFQRLHPRQDYDGTGIGLAICRRIAERLGGAITVDSVPGEGSTFTVSIPDVRGSAA
jgi:light-regulated signal transduction histidine kinase (bacteriophytochrome)